MVRVYVKGVTHIRTDIKAHMKRSWKGRKAAWPIVVVKGDSVDIDDIRLTTHLLI